jgi:hypothetical protein
MTLVPFGDYTTGEVTRIPTPQDVAVQRLGEWAQSADAAYRVAQRLVESSFVPQAFRGKPVEATAAILAGSEIGLSPMSALKAFDIIQGQAAPRAITQRAVAQAHGHSLVLIEQTATRCRIKCRRKGDDDWQIVTWTIDRARELGLTGKDAWKKQPTAMLLARATSEAARLVASDALLGIAYSVEEIADGGGVTDTPEAPAAESTGTRRMSRRRTAEPEPTPEPEPSGMDEFAPETTSNPEPITKAQLQKLAIVLKEAGYTDRDRGLAFIAEATGREVESSKDLTKAEASNLIDILDRSEDDEPADESALWPSVAQPGSDA